MPTTTSWSSTCPGRSSTCTFSDSGLPVIWRTRLTSAGAKSFATDCAAVQTSCVAGSDVGNFSESASYTNATGADQTIFIGVDTTDAYGGFYNLLVNSAAQCGASADCEQATQLGDYCEDFNCKDPSNGNGTRYPAASNGAGLAIPDGTNPAGMACAPGAPVTSAGMGGGLSTFLGTSQACPVAAAPARDPFKPASSISFPENVPSGLAKTLPALRMRGWVRMRCALNSLTSPSARSGVLTCSRSSTRSTATSPSSRRLSALVRYA